MQSFSKKSAIFLIFFSAVVLLGVLSLDYLFQLAPCRLCVYQRYPYVILLLVNVAWLLWGFARRYHRRMNGMLLLINALIPLIQVLAERGFILLKCPATSIRDNTETIIETLQKKSTCSPQLIEGFLTFAELHLGIAATLLCVFMWGWYVQKRDS